MRPTVSKGKLKLGDPALLELSMSEAAKRYGVSATVVPPRKRTTERAYA